MITWEPKHHADTGIYMATPFPRPTYWLCFRGHNVCRLPGWFARLFLKDAGG